MCWFTMWRIFFAFTLIALALHIYAYWRQYIMTCSPFFLYLILLASWLVYTRQCSYIYIQFFIFLVSLFPSVQSACSKYYFTHPSTPKLFVLFVGLCRMPLEVPCRYCLYCHISCIWDVSHFIENFYTPNTNVVFYLCCRGFHFWVFLTFHRIFHI